MKNRTLLPPDQLQQSDAFDKAIKQDELSVRNRIEKEIYGSVLVDCPVDSERYKVINGLLQLHKAGKLTPDILDAAQCHDSRPTVLFFQLIRKLI